MLGFVQFNMPVRAGLDQLQGEFAKSSFKLAWKSLPCPATNGALLDFKCKLKFVWISGSFICGQSKYIFVSFPFMVQEQLRTDRGKCHISQDGYSCALSSLPCSHFHHQSFFKISSPLPSHLHQLVAVGRCD